MKTNQLKPVLPCTFPLSTFTFPLLARMVLVLLTFSLHLSTAFGQSPNGISYQAVIRNSSNDLVSNQAVGMKISILQGSASGISVYAETQTPTTNANGLVSIEIGGGTVVSGNFASIDWANGSYFIKTETDPAGGTSYTITGTSQLLSVPYALHAKTAENFTGTITEIDPVFTAWDKSTGISITESQINDLGNYIETETQTLSDVIANNNAANGQIKNLTDPTEAQDAATKAYVDALLARIEALELSDLLNNGFTDSRDGNHYNAVRIGNQVWMAENLKYLPSVSGPVTGSQTIPYYYVYDYYGTDVTAAKATTNYTTYGVLYNWAAAMNGAASSAANPSGVQGVCPAGWHLPSDAEWTQLTDYLGGVSVAGGKLKEAGTTHWYSPNTGATDESGFTALPGGYCFSSGSFHGIGNDGYWWSASESDANNAWYRYMVFSYSFVNRYYDYKVARLAVRCVRD